MPLLDSDTPTEPGTGPLPVRRRALEVALSKLGQYEEGGENQGPIVEWSTRRWPGGRKPVRWCAGFVSTCIREAGAPAEWLKIGTLSCDTLWARCMERGWARCDSKGLAPGDLVFFGDAQDLHHVGFIEEVFADSMVVGARPLERIATIEGNSGNAVARHEYPLTDRRIYGFVRIPW
jgi:hypothetical protein